MFAEPAAWQRLLGRIAEAVADFAAAQVQAGASAIQVFDSWVGLLGPADYEARVAAHSARVLRSIGGAPSIHFGTGASSLLEAMAAAGGDVIGLDHRVSLDDAWSRLGPGLAVQGNLDPARLLGDRATVEDGAASVLAAADGRPGHIFNLGHAVLPGTRPEVLAHLAEFVHEQSRRSVGAGSPAAVR
jgi:uroporphyrinogen decarboxylase